MSRSTFKGCLAVGDRGALAGVEVEVVGMAQWVSDDDYAYQEYALRDNDAQAWSLEQDDGHFVLYRDVDDVPEPSVYAAATGQNLHYGGRTWAQRETETYQLTFRTEHYWKEHVQGHRQIVCSYASRPYVLAQCRDDAAAPSSWSEGVYVDAREVTKAFGVNTLPRSRYPHIARPVPYRPWSRALIPMMLLVAAMSMVAGIATLAAEEPNPLLHRSIPLASNQDLHLVGRLDSDGKTPLLVKANAALDQNEWATVTVGLHRLPPDAKNLAAFKPLADVRIHGDVGNRTTMVGKTRQTVRTSLLSRQVIPAGRWAVTVAWKLGPTKVSRLGRLSLTLAQSGSTPSLMVVWLSLWSVMLFFAAIVGALGVAWKRSATAEDDDDDDDDDDD